MMASWLKRAGLALRSHEVLPPPARNGKTGLTVSIWLASRPPAGNAPVRRRAVADSIAN